MKNEYLDLIGKSLWVFKTDSFHLYEIKNVAGFGYFIFLSVETIIGRPAGFTSVSFELEEFFKLYSDKKITIHNPYVDCDTLYTISEEIAIKYITDLNIKVQ